MVVESRRTGSKEEKGYVNDVIYKYQSESTAGVWGQFAVASTVVGGLSKSVGPCRMMIPADK
jgi:hypothetical protein